MEVIDGLLQPCATKDLLRHSLQAVLKVDTDIRRHVVLGDLLLLDQDHSFRLIRRRQKPAHNPDGQPAEKEGKQEPPAASPSQRPEFFQVYCLWFSFVFVHG